MVSIDSSAVQWRDAAGGREGSHLLVIMHGFGSYEGDLFSLAPALPAHLTIAALRAPETLRPAAPHMQGSYAWLELTEGPAPRDRIEAPVAAVLEWLDSLPEQYASVGLMGFSQGGLMALQLARTQPERFAYLVQLSGFVHPDPLEGDAVLKSRTPLLPAFQAAGSYDDVIGAARTAAVTTWMAEHLDTESHEYPMAHSVVPEELRHIAAFLERVTGDTAA